VKFRENRGKREKNIQATTGADMAITDAVMTLYKG